MNRRTKAAAAVGALLALLVALGGWLSASATPEGPPDGAQVDVLPSDNLPSTSTSDVVATNFFSEVAVTAAQCYPNFAACGPAATLTPDPQTPGRHTGQLLLVRMLTVTDPSSGGLVVIDCFVETCAVWVTGGSSGTHHLTFAPDPTTTVPQRGTTTTVKATTTTVPPTTTTTTPATTSTTRRLTIPPTTRARVTTTTVHPTSTTSTTAPPSTTTSSSTTTTTVPPPPPGDHPTLIAVTPKNEPSGPPGGGLHVQGSGYTCPTVYFFFDGTRVGSDTPDAAGHVSKGDLSVPGNSGKGAHKVTSSCEASGNAIVQASVFDVVPVAVHRPAIVTSLPLPDQISLAPGQLLASAAIAMGAIMLIAFPYELFNSTIEENYDEIRGWFGLGPRVVPEVKGGRALTFIGLTAVAAAACGFLSPDFGLNKTSAVLFLGIFLAMVVMAIVFSLPADLGIRREFGEWGTLNFLPGTVLISIVMVLLSRVLHFQPGYFYGAMAGLAFRSALSEKVAGKMTALNWIFSLVISVGAFFLRAPVSAAASEPGASIWWIGLEICLAMIFLWGVEGLAVAMLPMRFLDGRKVLAWSRAAWAVLFFLGVFATVHVLLRPGSGYVGKTSGTVTIGVMSLFAAFGLISVGLWAYFRFRPERWVPIRARA